jgi:hypothetical protein
MPDGYGGFSYREPRDTNESCERIALHLGGQLLTRAADILPGIDHVELSRMPRLGYGVDVTDFYHRCAHNEDGTPKALPGPARSDLNTTEDLLAFEDLATALGANHFARLSSALDEANAAGLEIAGFDFEAADPLNPKFVLKQVAEELGLKPIDAEYPVSLQQAWKEVMTDTVKRVHKHVSERVRARAQRISETRAVASMLKRTEDGQESGRHYAGDNKL